MRKLKKYLNSLLSCLLLMSSINVQTVMALDVEARNGEMKTVVYYNLDGSELLRAEYGIDEVIDNGPRLGQGVCTLGNGDKVKCEHDNTWRKEIVSPTLQKMYPNYNTLGKMFDVKVHYNGTVYFDEAMDEGSKITLFTSGGRVLHQTTYLNSNLEIGYPADEVGMVFDGWNLSRISKTEIEFHPIFKDDGIQRVDLEIRTRGSDKVTINGTNRYTVEVGTKFKNIQGKPTFSYPQGWTSLGFEIDGTDYTLEELQEYTIESDTVIIAKSKMDVMGNGNATCTVPDGVDDREQFKVDFLNHDDSLFECHIYNNGATVTGPKTTPVKEGFVFDKWDKEFYQIFQSTQVRPIFISGESFNVTATFKGETVYTGSVLKGKKFIVKDSTGAELHNVTVDKDTTVDIQYNVPVGQMIGQWVVRSEDNNVVLVPSLQTIDFFKISFVVPTSEEGNYTLTKTNVDLVPGTLLNATMLPKTDNGWTVTGYKIDGITYGADMMLEWIFEKDTTVEVYAMPDVIGADNEFKDGPDGIDDRLQARVVFRDWDNSHISSVVVFKGSSAQKPSDPVREGFKFTGWGDVDLTYVTTDLEVVAQYISLEDATFNLKVTLGGQTYFDENIRENDHINIYGRDGSVYDDFYMIENTTYDYSVTLFPGEQFTGFDYTVDGSEHHLRPIVVEDLYSVSFFVRFGDEVELSKYEVKVAKGQIIGADNMPVITLPEGWVIDGFYQADGAYTFNQVANRIVSKNEIYEVRAYPDMMGEGDGNITTPDGIDDREQARVIYYDRDMEHYKDGVYRKALGLDFDKPSREEMDSYYNTATTSGALSFWSCEYIKVTDDNGDYVTDEEGNVVLLEDVQCIAGRDNLTIKVSINPDLNAGFETVNFEETNIIVVKDAKGQTVDTHNVTKKLTTVRLNHDVTPEAGYYYENYYEVSESTDAYGIKTLTYSPKVGMQNKTLTYVMNAGDNGEITISTYEIPVNTTITTDRLPEVTFDTGWYLGEYKLNNETITAEELANVVMDRDMTVTITSYPDVIGQDDADCTTPDGIDDRTQRVVTFLNWDNSVVRKNVVLAGSSLTPPTADEVLSMPGKEFKGWDQVLENITTNLTVRPVFGEILYNVTLTHDGSTVYTAKLPYGTMLKAYKNDYNDEALIYTVTADMTQELEAEIKDEAVVSHWRANTIEGGIEFRPVYADKIYTVNFEVRVGDEAQLSFTEVNEILHGSTLSKAQIPSVTLNPEWVLVGYMVNGVTYTYEELQTLAIERNTTVVIMTMPDRVGQDDVNCNTPDGIDDRLQAIAIFMADDDLVKQVVTMKGEVPVAPTKEEVEAVYSKHGKADFLGWDKELVAIEHNVVYNAVRTPYVLSININLEKDKDAQPYEFKEGGIINIYDGQDVLAETLEVERDLKEINLNHNIIVPNLEYQGYYTLSCNDTSATSRNTQVCNLNPVMDYEYKTVTFEMNEGDQGLVSGSVRLPINTSLTLEQLPEVITPDGWFFSHYIVDGNSYELEHILNYVVTKDLVVKVATYPDGLGGVEDGIDDRTQVLVTYVDHNDSILGTELVVKGKDANGFEMPEASSKEGYHFVGWDKSLTAIEENTTVKALYEINEYDVVMDFQGRDFNIGKIKHGDSLKVYDAYGEFTETVIKGDYRFTYLPGNKPNSWLADFEVEVYEYGYNGIVVTPVFVLNKYLVEFILRVGDQGEIASHEIIVEYGSTMLESDVPVITLPQGWYLSAYEVNGTIMTYAEMVQMPIEDRTLVVVHTIPDMVGEADGTCSQADGIDDRLQATATFKVDGEVVACRVVLKGETPKAPVVSKVGHTHVGWDKAIVNIQVDTEYEALFVVNEYVVTVNNPFGETTSHRANHGSVIAITQNDGSIKTTVVNSDMTVNLDVYEYPYADHIGWDIEKYNGGIRFTPTLEKHKLSIKFTINLGDLGSLEFDEVLDVEADMPLGKDVIPNIELPDGWKLKGFEVKYLDVNTREAVRLYSYEELCELVIDRPLEIIVHTYPDNGDDNIDDRLQAKVTFVDEDGNVIDEFMIIKGENFETPVAPVKGGFDFVGWDKSTDNVTEDTVFTAVYKEKEVVPPTEPPVVTPPTDNGNNNNGGITVTPSETPDTGVANKTPWNVIVMSLSSALCIGLLLAKKKDEDAE